MRILAFDPGGTTGVAVIDVDIDNDGLMSSPKLKEFSALNTTVKDPLFIVTAINAIIGFQKPDHIAIECTNLSDSHIPVFIAGMIYALSINHNTMPTLQAPSDKTAKMRQSSQMLRYHEIHYKSKPHVTDALAHALAFVSRCIRNGSIDKNR